MSWRSDDVFDTRLSLFPHTISIPLEKLRYKLLVA